MPDEEQSDKTEDEELKAVRREEKDWETKKNETVEKRGLRKRIKEHKREIHHPVYSRFRRELPEKVNTAKQGTVHAVKQIGHELKYGKPDHTGSHVRRYVKSRRLRSQPAPSAHHTVNYGGNGEPSDFGRRLMGEEGPRVDLLGGTGSYGNIDLLGGKKRKIKL